MVKQKVIKPVSSDSKLVAMMTRGGKKASKEGAGKVMPDASTADQTQNAKVCNSFKANTLYIHSG